MTSPCQLLVSTAGRFLGQDYRWASVGDKVTPVDLRATGPVNLSAALGEKVDDLAKRSGDSRHSCLFLSRIGGSLLLYVGQLETSRRESLYNSPLRNSLVLIFPVDAAAEDTVRLLTASLLEAISDEDGARRLGLALDPFVNFDGGPDNTLGWTAQLAGLTENLFQRVSGQRPPSPLRAAQPGCRYAKRSQERCGDLAMELKAHALPGGDGDLIAVLQYATEVELKQWRPWRSLGGLVQAQQWSDLAVASPFTARVLPAPAPITAPPPVQPAIPSPQPSEQPRPAIAGPPPPAEDPVARRKAEWALALAAAAIALALAAVYFARKP